MDFSSFLASEFPDTTPENAGFHIIPVPLERTVSYGAGTHLGPAAILEASQQLEAWDGISSPGTLGFHTCEPINCEQSLDAVFADIMAKVRTALDHGAIPVTLGGEHTVSYAPIRALHDEGKEFGILHFDAHADLRNIYEGDAFSHACVLRRVVEDCGLLSSSAPETTARKRPTSAKRQASLSTMLPSLPARDCPGNRCPNASPKTSMSLSTWMVWIPRSCRPQAHPPPEASSGMMPCTFLPPVSRAEDS